jgi:hypothetical protein
MLLGGDADALRSAAAGAPDIEWLAPARGFLVRCATG